jgi:hypothetical protein
MPKMKRAPAPPLFDEWQRYLFQRPTELCTIYNEKMEHFIDRAGQFDFATCSASPDQTCDHFIYTMHTMTAVAEQCSEQQITYGLNYIFNSSFSNLPFQLRAAEPLARRIAAIDAIHEIYAGFLRWRCQPVLGHRSESVSRLDSFHYMLWDVTPLTRWCGLSDPPRIMWPLLSMLERVLYIPHNGCIESALHGLGHMVYQRKDHVIPSIIEKFILATPGLRPELRTYALAAREGYIQ